MTFVEAMQFTLRHERGWWPGGPSDPNPTLDGVTQRVYSEYRRQLQRPDQSVQLMTAVECEDIYRAYWVRCHAMALPPKAAVAHFCFSFNAGVDTGLRRLQRALGGLTVDGKWGPKTAAAAQTARDGTLIPALCLEHLDHYATIATRPALRPNLLGWVNRVVDVYRTYGRT